MKGMIGRGLLVLLGLVLLGTTGISATIRLTDNNWNSQTEFRIGDRVVAADRLYVEVEDPTDPAPSVYVHLSCPATGDEVRLTLERVNPNVYRFRNPDPGVVFLVPATGTSPVLTDNRLEVHPGNTIRVYYINPGNPSITARQPPRPFLAR